MLRQTTSARPKSERILVALFIVFACLTTAQAIYNSYAVYFVGITSAHPGLTQQQYYREHTIIALTSDHPLFSGTDFAPDQYRIGIEYPVKLVATALHVAKFYQIITVLDFFTGVAVCVLLYSLLCGSPFFQNLDAPLRSCAVALLLASVAYPLFWAVAWVRPETLPSGLYLVLMLFFLNRLREQPRSFAIMAVITIWQSFIRADVAAMLGVAIVLFSLAASAASLFGSRRRALLTGLCVLTIALAVQALLQFVLFPHRTYPPDGPVVQFFLNFGLRRLAVFLIAMLPYVFVLSLAAKSWRRLDPIDILAIIASCVYLPLWFTVGIVLEVRIFVPFLLVLTPSAAKLLLLMLTGTGSNAPLDAGAPAGVQTG